MHNQEIAEILESYSRGDDRQQRKGILAISIFDTLRLNMCAAMYGDAPITHAEATEDFYETLMLVTRFVKIAGSSLLDHDVIRSEND